MTVYKGKSCVLALIFGFIGGCCVVWFVSNSSFKEFLYYKQIVNNSNSSFEKKNIINEDECLHCLLSTSKNFGHGSKKMSFTLKYGSDLFTTLLQNGFNRDDVTNVINILRKKINLHSLKENQIFHVNYTFEMKFMPSKSRTNLLPEKHELTEVRKIEKIFFKQPDGSRYIIENNDGAYLLHIERPELIKKIHVISGTITNGLFKDVLTRDIKMNTLYNTLNEYGFLIDFQRDIHKGDKFIIVLDTVKDGDGDTISEKVLYSNLILMGKKYEIFNFHDNFYDRKGQSVQKTLLKTPIDGARVSSNFNLHRKHPVLGYVRAHRGIDLAAPTGTHIYSAGDGVVVELDNAHESYGKFVTIRHNDQYMTRYAHMSRIAKIKVGQSVKQRQIIGYVGMTGLATGPHLHYEVMRYGKHINPSTIKVVSIKQVDAKNMENFKRTVKNIDSVLLKK